MHSDKIRKSKYILSLVGKKRLTETTVVEDSPKSDQENLQYNLMAQMVENGIDLEKELFTPTIEAQRATEDEIKELYDDLLENGETPHLLREKHIRFLKMTFGQLPAPFKAMDHSQPWIFYWVTTSLTLLGYKIPEDIKISLVSKLLGMFHKDGGIGGGPHQIGHVAATYSGILALSLIADKEVWSSIDRKAMYEWLWKLKGDDGSFAMHVGGERDTRATYCVLVTASALNILTPELVEGTAKWISKCQTYEGGFGGTPFDEAHGGYTYCAAASLLILGRETFLTSCNLDKLVHWASTKQLNLEGGFSGRTNKLVDGCYSFWVGGLIPIFDIILGEEEAVSRAGLQNYILACCQNDRNGGLRDKPSKQPDFYHTTYCLFGLAIAQNKFNINQKLLRNFTSLNSLDSFAYAFDSHEISDSIVNVDEFNKIGKFNPIFPLPEGVINKYKEYFTTQPFEHFDVFV
ncbi:hypothetical protein WICMUC_005373 [Wickerhamomyces mucosus]|uniref:Protein farnesyltransferase subunit beta n=1 Tax=Wickerhamomyces mucosus TaxID=1378264 RepID=A0A9P8T6K6_9ASCO|nr:hypothetical protein WICMUC_005373 [Wickerhamomyces mucosus]